MTTAAALVALAAGRAAAQPSPASAAADDQPSIHVGVLVFADYAVSQRPTITDADGNAVTLNQFEVTRSYVNVSGNISKSISFRVTPDIAREAGAGSSGQGGYAVRLKYAYAQWNVDRLGKNAWVRFGSQPGPWISFLDEVYRYRFQGQLFEERDGFLISADVGATWHCDLPRDYGDVHAGVMNGEGYSHAEENDRKAWMVRGSLRPLPAGPELVRGLRVSGFYDHDMHVKNGERQRTVAAVTYQHRFLSGAFDYLAATDRTSARGTLVEGRGWSAWVVPRTTTGWEGLIRLDRVSPDRSNPAMKRHRTIAGIAYWFPRPGVVATALLLDVDDVRLSGYPAAQPPHQLRLAVHALVTF